MKLTIIVQAAYLPQPLSFARAVLAAGHEIPLVFFYQEGVNDAAVEHASDNDDSWQSFQEDTGVELAVCIGAASRRGLVDNYGQPLNGKAFDTHFSIVGLGQLIGALGQSDRVVTFNG